MNLYTKHMVVDKTYYVYLSMKIRGQDIKKKLYRKQNKKYIEKKN